jgi:hypothetical protein
MDMRTAESILAEHGIEPPPPGKNRYYTVCPQCSASRSRAHQKTPCLGVTVTKDGVRWGCNHCDFRSGGFFNGKGNGRGGDEFVAMYSYTNENDELLFQVCRTAEKQFPQRRPDGNGGWIWNPRDCRKVLYRLPELIEAVAGDHTILLVEGEKDANAAWQIGIPATCSPGGAAKPGQRSKWLPDYNEALRDAEVVIIPDHDSPGYAHARAAAKALTGIARRVRILKLAEHWPDCPKGGDLSDWNQGWPSAGTARCIDGASARLRACRRNDCRQCG